MSRGSSSAAPVLRAAGIAAVLIGFGGGLLALHQRTSRTACSIGIIGGADGPTHNPAQRARRWAEARRPAHVPPGAAVIGVIGGTDGPTAVFTTTRRQKRRQRGKVRVFRGTDGPTAVCYVPPGGGHRWPPEEANIIGGAEGETAIYTREAFSPGHLPGLFLAVGALLLTLHKRLRERRE